MRDISAVSFSLALLTGSTEVAESRRTLPDRFGIRLAGTENSSPQSQGIQRKSVYSRNRFRPSAGFDFDPFERFPRVYSVEQLNLLP